MLTYHLGLLSNPVNPKLDTIKSGAKIRIILQNAMLFEKNV